MKTCSNLKSQAKPTIIKAKTKKKAYKQGGIRRMMIYSVYQEKGRKIYENNSKVDQNYESQKQKLKNLIKNNT